MGPEKFKLRQIIINAKKAGHLKLTHTVPHFTLYGTFNLGNTRLSQLRDCIEETAKKYDSFEFTVDGYEWKNNADGRGKVIAFKVRPSDSLLKFKKEITAKLLRITPQTKSFDRKGEAWFHITIGNHLSDKSYTLIWNYLNKDDKGILDSVLSLFTGKKRYNKVIPYLLGFGTRITLLNDRSKIVFEYDLLQKRFLSREEALSSRQMKRTLALLRFKTGTELTNKPKLSHDDPFIVSDLHLDHTNIIRYCYRPFLSKDTEEMNRVLINNWNNTIDSGDTVYFLGDLVYGKSSHSHSYWTRQLNGKIVYIGGNHDAGLPNKKEYKILNFGGHDFLLIHDPNKIPIRWDGWIIHGHKHNNDIRDYPFINGDKRTINVSIELIGYRPLNLRTLLSLDIDSIKRMDTIHSQPVRKEAAHHLKKPRV